MGRYQSCVERPVKNLCTVIIVDGVGLTDLENLSAHTQLKCVERPKNYGLWRLQMRGHAPVEQ
jgi:hypothetical protein